MLGMGITLSVDDFKRALTMPRAVAVGLAALRQGEFPVIPCRGFSPIANRGQGAQILERQLFRVPRFFA
jgi:hypothetical protein